MDYYSIIKKNEIVPFVTTLIDLEGIILSEMSEKDKCCMISFTYEIERIQQTSEYNKEETDSQIQRTNNYQQEQGRRVRQDRGMGLRDYWGNYHK